MFAVSQARKLSKGELQALFPPPFSNFHLSPKGLSLNDQINEDIASVSYVTFEKAVSVIRTFIQGTLLANSDIKLASRLLPIWLGALNSPGFQFEGDFILKNDSQWVVQCLVFTLKHSPPFWN